MTISENIFRILREKRISQKEFSRMTGIAESTICDWKHKGKSPNSDKISTICNALEITPYDLMDDLILPEQEVNQQVVDMEQLLSRIDETDKKVDRLLAYIAAGNDNR